MMRLRNWLPDLLVAVSGALCLWFIGLRMGHPQVFLVIAGLLYLGWHIFQIHRTILWLAKPKTLNPPYRFGMWRHIIEDIERLLERGRKRKRKLGQIITGFHESMNALPDATVVLEAPGEMIWWNRAATRILGLEIKRHKGLHILKVIPDPQLESYLEQANYGNPLYISAPLDRSVRLEVRVVPYGKGKLLLQARDITRLQQLETVRRDFVANASHELRTPLTVVHGYVETMHDSGDSMLSLWRPILDQMYQQTERMQRIVGDLLTLSRLESDDRHMELDVVNMSPLLLALKETAVSLSGDLKHHIELEYLEDLNLVGNREEIDSAFSNLVFNAVRYTPAGGSIKLRWWSEQGCPCFSVSDTGFGIAAEHIPRLTERFYRVDVGRSRQSGGTGLGLAIVKHVLNRHGGHLDIESEIGKGSTFSCWFPASRLFHEPSEELDNLPCLLH